MPKTSHAWEDSGCVRNVAAIFVARNGWEYRHGKKQRLGGKRSDDALELRDSKGRFMPSNPSKGSRPKKIPEELREAFRELVPRSVEVIAEILNNRKTRANVRLEAVKVVLDRVYGKPAQAQDITLDVSGSLDLTAQIRRVLLETETENDGCGIEVTD